MKDLPLTVLLQRAKNESDDLKGELLSTTSKLGPPDVARGFSLPREETCFACTPNDPPISTEPCVAVCYVGKSHEGRPSVVERERRNWVLAQQAGFPLWMITELQRKGTQLMKLHVGGEFFSAEYVQHWRRIVRASPRVTFLVYTRVWRKPRLLEHLERLAAEPNVNLLLSADRKANDPPEMASTRVAWLALADDEVPPPELRSRVEVVFRASRERHHRRLKTLGGAVVCPLESGSSVETNCYQCRHCLFKERPTT